MTLENTLKVTSYCSLGPSNVAIIKKRTLLHEKQIRTAFRLTELQHFFKKKDQVQLQEIIVYMYIT